MTSNKRILLKEIPKGKLSEDHFEQQSITEMFTAKYPGVIGNSIAVSAFAIESGESAASSNTASAWASWEYADRFDAIPGTSTWASNQSEGNR